MISAKRLVKIGFVLVLQIAMMVGGLLGSDVALAYDAQERYNERYEYCMKSDDRGSAYCSQWAGPSNSSYDQRPSYDYDPRPSYDDERRPSYDMMESKIAKFHDCIEKSDNNLESCKQILFKDN